MESSIAVFLMRQFACEQLPMLRRSLIMVAMWLTRAAISGRFAAVVRSASLPIVLFVLAAVWRLCVPHQFQVGSRLSSGLLHCP